MTTFTSIECIPIGCVPTQYLEMAVAIEHKIKVFSNNFFDDIDGHNYRDKNCGI
jgi:hypothetical protein